MAMLTCGVMLPYITIEVNRGIGGGRPCPKAALGPGRCRKLFDLSLGVRTPSVERNGTHLLAVIVGATPDRPVRCKAYLTNKHDR
jgi:hypothetical protein